MKESSRSARIYFLTFIQVISLSSCAQQTRPYEATPSGVNPQAASQKSRAFTVDINKASRKELEALPGIGRVLAERIVAHREKYGPFRRVEHLIMVRGISDRKFRDLQSLVSVE